MNANTSSTKWVMLGLSYLVLIACFIPYIGWSVALLDISEEFSLSATQAGLLGSITALVGGLILPFAGVIGDRWGIKRIILVGIVASLIGQLLFSWAPDYTLLMLGRAVSGIGVGLLFVGPYTMAVNWFERERKSGIALGVMFTSDGIGSAFALYAFAIVLVALGWRTGSAVGGAFLVAIFIIAALFLKDAPKPEPAAVADTTEPDSGRSLASWLFSRNVLVAAAFFIGEWGIFAVVAVWMPTILIEGAGWDATLAGLFSSLYVVIGMITSIGFGLVSDRLGRRKGLIVIAGIAMTVFMGVLTLGLSSGNYVLVALCLPLVGLGVYTGMPLALALAAESVPTRMAGAVNGFVLGIGFIVGGFVYPYFIGVVKDATGDYTVGFIAMVVATLVLNFVIALFAKDVRRAPAGAVTVGEPAVTRG
ncbi:MFS transporter [Leucobacter japonicus]|uniref:MFS transporter n=1 Tax=Leucobacter japonicus TaxID=1461259 RepID=UPI0006A7C91A|nr:MFS transporter [Leucobacter japonicus]